METEQNLVSKMTNANHKLMSLSNVLHKNLKLLDYIFNEYQNLADDEIAIMCDNLNKSLKNCGKRLEVLLSDKTANQKIVISLINKQIFLYQELNIARQLKSNSSHYDIQ